MYWQTQPRAGQGGDRPKQPGVAIGNEENLLVIKEAWVIQNWHVAP
jgi:hypothetical protein